MWRCLVVKNGWSLTTSASMWRSTAAENALSSSASVDVSNNEKFKTEVARRYCRLSRIGITRIARIDEHASGHSFGRQTMQKFEPLAPHRGRGEHGHAR